MKERHLICKGELKLHLALSPAPPEASLWCQLVREATLALPSLSLTELLPDPTTAWGVVLGAGGHEERGRRVSHILYSPGQRVFLCGAPRVKGCRGSGGCVAFLERTDALSKDGKAEGAVQHQLITVGGSLLSCPPALWASCRQWPESRAKGL